MEDSYVNTLDRRNNVGVIHKTIVFLDITEDLFDKSIINILIIIAFNHQECVLFIVNYIL